MCVFVSCMCVCDCHAILCLVALDVHVLEEREKHFIWDLNPGLLNPNSRIALTNM